MPKCSVPCSTEMVSWKKDCRNKSAHKGQHYKWEYLREIPQEVQGGEGDGCMWTLFSKYLFTHQYQFDNLIILLTSCVSWTHNTWWMSLSTSNISCLCKHTCTTHVWNVDKISFTRSIKANMKPTNPPPPSCPCILTQINPARTCHRSPAAVRNCRKAALLIVCKSDGALRSYSQNRICIEEIQNTSIQYTILTCRIEVNGK